MSDRAIGRDDIRGTHERIAPYVHRTPVLTSRTLDERAGCSVYLKCENFQRTGSFKIRGAISVISRLGAEELRRGVICHSSGNHAQAVALAARTFKTQARIVMPSGAPAIKRAATEDYGADVTLCDPTLEARERTTRELMERTGAVLVHPYDNDFTIMGQSTAALEFLEEVPDLDLILAPVGGGGLISGTALAAAFHERPVRAIGCEPAQADDAYRSLREGRLILDPAGETMADGLRTNLCPRTFSIIQQRVEDIILVGEAEIEQAMAFIWKRMKIVIEPSSAVAIAPLLKGANRLEAKKIGVIVSGGNVALALG